MSSSSQSKQVLNTEMGSEMTTNLYQVPLNPSDVANFIAPSQQPQQGAMNCASVSLLLLRLINKSQAESNASRVEGVSLDAVIEFFNTKIKGRTFSSQSLPINDTSVYSIQNSLFEQCATIVLGTRSKHAIGHYFVFFKYKDTLYILDAQTKVVKSGLDEINSYLKSAELDDTFFIITINSRATKGDIYEIYTDYILTDMLSDCSIKGGKRKQKHSRKRVRSQKKRTRRNFIKKSSK